MKDLRALLVFLLVLAAASRGYTQTKKRIAIIPFGTQFFQAEQNIANQLNDLLAEGGQIEVVDRASTARILAEQNMQNNNGQQQPRFSADSATKLGEMLGVPAIVFVRVDAWSGGPRTVTNGKKHTTYGNVALKATAQIINVQTGAIIGAPTAVFDQQRVISESTDGRPPRAYGSIRIPAGNGTQGEDPQIGMRKLTDDAFTSVEHELVPKIASAVVAANLRPSGSPKIPKVAGVQDGITFVNVGTNDGLKVGSTFQIVRMVDTGMQDPDTHKTLFRKKQICVLTISEVEESLASGKCAGDIAQSSDQAVAIRD